MNDAARLDEVDVAAPTAATPAFTVIIPACNEAAVIARCLNSLAADSPHPAAMEIIVAVNGTRDDTVRIAQAEAPCAKVIEIEQASKARAINRAMELARHDLRIVVDADVLTGYRALAATAQCLSQPGVMAASPAIEIDCSRASKIVKAYYRVWQRLPYATERLIGGGVYGLSRAGWEAIGQLPDVIGDDLYVRTRFGFDERRTVAHDACGNPVRTTIFPPRNAFDLLRTEARRRRGKLQVDRHFPTAETGTINGGKALLAALARGARMSDLAVYVTIKLAAAALCRWQHLIGHDQWSRDLSSRGVA